MAYNHFGESATTSVRNELTLKRSRHPYFPLNLATRAIRGKAGLDAVLTTLRIVRKFGGHISSHREEMPNWTNTLVLSMARTAKKKKGPAALRAMLRELDWNGGWLALPGRDFEGTWIPSIRRMLRKIA